MSEGWLLAGAGEEELAPWSTSGHGAVAGAEPGPHVVAAIAINDTATAEITDPVGDAVWRAEAACQSTSPDLFFPVGATGIALVEIAAAKFVCSQCAVREPCLEYALLTNQEYGIWGGFSEEERRVLRRRRRQASSRGATVPATVAPSDAGAS